MGAISWAAQAFGPEVIVAAIVAVLAFVWWLWRRDVRAGREAARRDAAGRRGEPPPPG